MFCSVKVVEMVFLPHLNEEGIDRTVYFILGNVVEHLPTYDISFLIRGHYGPRHGEYRTFLSIPKFRLYFHMTTAFVTVHIDFVRKNPVHCAKNECVVLVHHEQRHR